MYLTKRAFFHLNRAVSPTTNHKIIAIFTPLKGIISDISAFQPVENSFLPVSSQKRPKSAWQARFQLIQHRQTPAKTAYRVENSPFLWKTHALHKATQALFSARKKRKSKMQASLALFSQDPPFASTIKKEALLQELLYLFSKKSHYLSNFEP